MPIPVGVGLFALAALIVAGTSSSDGGGGAAPGGGPLVGPGVPVGPDASKDLLACAKAFDALPTDMRNAVLGAMDSTTATASQLEDLAKSLEVGAAATPDPTLKAALQTAAKCVRDKAALQPGGPSKDLVLDEIPCDVAFAALPADVQTNIVNARKSMDPTQVAATASALNALAAVTADPTLKARLLVAAKCLGAGGSAVATPSGTDGDTTVQIFDENGVSSTTIKGGAPRKGHRSNPNFQWIHVVKAGENANEMVAQIFGPSGVTVAKVEALINNNPKEQNGRTLGPIRRDWAAGTPGQSPGVLNWTSLRAGDRLRIPKAFNTNIDEQGWDKGDPSAWPV